MVPRFPLHVTARPVGGAEVLLAPSAFTVPTGQAHWEVLLRARAIEHQCFMVAAAQVGAGLAAARRNPPQTHR